MAHCRSTCATRSSKHGLLHEPGRSDEPLSRTQTVRLQSGGRLHPQACSNTDKKKLFFFFSTSQQPFSCAASSPAPMPTERERNGDFSQTVRRTAPAFYPRSSDERAVPGKLIPSSRFDQFASRFSSFPAAEHYRSNRRAPVQLRQSSVCNTGSRARGGDQARLQLSRSRHADRRYVQDINDIVTDYFTNFSLANTRLAGPERRPCSASTGPTPKLGCDEMSFGYTAPDQAGLKTMRPGRLPGLYYGVTLSSSARTTTRRAPAEY